MSKLTEYLLKNNNLSEQEFTVSLQGRFKDEGLTFTVRRITMDEFSSYQKESVRNITKNGSIVPELDGSKLALLVVLNSCTDPNFKNAEFINALECQTPEQAIKKVLLPGEITRLSAKIMEISGLANDINDEIEEIKK